MSIQGSECIKCLTGSAKVVWADRKADVRQRYSSPNYNVELACHSWREVHDLTWPQGCKPYIVYDNDADRVTLVYRGYL
jgi:hypothetical protein